MRSHRTNYLRVRREIDAQLASKSPQTQGLPFAAGAAALIIPMLLVFVPAVPQWALQGSWLIGLALWALWVIFLIWRAARLIRAGDYKSARDYDRRGKFLLPPEYAASESYLSHRRRSRQPKP